MFRKVTVASSPFRELRFRGLALKSGEIGGKTLGFGIGIKVHFYRADAVPNRGERLFLFQVRNYTICPNSKNI